jgi:mannose-6-phosphate isomerase-like protein (cupin superfamily)
MTSDGSSSPFLPFGSTEERPYGTIRLFDSAAEITARLPFQYSRFIVSAGSASRLDQHKVQEAWVVLSGKGSLLFDGNRFNLKAGDVVHFESMLTHQVENDGTEDMEIFSFWWKGD